MCDVILLPFMKTLCSILLAAANGAVYACFSYLPILMFA